MNEPDTAAEPPRARGRQVNIFTKAAELSGRCKLPNWKLNKPCPCGSGKKLKKCCAQKYLGPAVSIVTKGGA